MYISDDGDDVTREGVDEMRKRAQGVIGAEEWVAVKRHCRIGKVYPKPKRWTGSKLLDCLKGQPIYPSYPLINDFKPKGN